MRNCLKITATAAMAASLQGCFVYVPGNVTGAVSDVITGDEGENCVAEPTKAGDLIKLPNGAIMKVQSLSGRSHRCTDPDLPVRALLVAPEHHTNVQIALPPGWEAKPVAEVQKGRGVIFASLNRPLDANLQLSSRTMARADEFQQVAEELAQAHMRMLVDPTASAMQETSCAGHRAYITEITGTTNRRTYTYVDSFVQGETEVAVVSVWTKVEKYQAVADALKATCKYLNGL